VDKFWLINLFPVWLFWKQNLRARSPRKIKVILDQIDSVN
jgi:hypothetical protein